MLNIAFELLFNISFNKILTNPTIFVLNLNFIGIAVTYNVNKLVIGYTQYNL